MRGGEQRKAQEAGKSAPGGLIGWVVNRLRHVRGAKPRMALVERITLGPRQTLAMVEADGRRILVATSPEGGPAFMALDERRHAAVIQQPKAPARISW